MSQIVVRVDPEDKELAASIARKRGEDLSSLVRRAIKMEFARLKLLDEDQMKVLGLELNQNLRVESHERRKA